MWPQERDEKDEFVLSSNFRGTASVQKWVRPNVGLRYNRHWNNRYAVTVAVRCMLGFACFWSISFCFMRGHLHLGWLKFPKWIDKWKSPQHCFCWLKDEVPKSGRSGVVVLTHRSKLCVPLYCFLSFKIYTVTSWVGRNSYASVWELCEKAIETAWDLRGVVHWVCV